MKKKPFLDFIVLLFSENSELILGMGNFEVFSNLFENWQRNQQCGTRTDIKKILNSFFFEKFENSEAFPKISH